VNLSTTGATRPGGKRRDFHDAFMGWDSYRAMGLRLGGQSPFIDLIEERMRKLSVTTLTTPVELADLFNDLSPDDEVGGKPGIDGAVVLYVCCGGGSSPLRYASSRSAVAARVAIDVVLQQVEGMPGAHALARDVREQLTGDCGARAGCLAPPLTMLASLYRRTRSAMPATTGRIPIVPAASYTENNNDSDVSDLASVTAEQRQALENLIDKLMQLPCPSKQAGRC
jgi:hypothetical protein